MTKLHNIKVFDDRAKEIELCADIKGYPIDEDARWIFICTKVIWAKDQIQWRNGRAYMNGSVWLWQA